MTNTVTTVRLPHTGLRVPAQTLTTTRYRELDTGRGIAFTANLLHGTRVVGTIENGGTGGMTFFRPANQQVFNETHLDEYAARCVSAEGAPVTAEDVLNELVEEGEWTLKVGRAERRKRLALRRMDATHGDAYASGEWDSAVPRTDEQWRELGERIVAAVPPGDGEWWQGWHGGGWRDVTARPARVDPGLYL